MSLFATADELGAELLPTLSAFLAGPAGDQARAAVAELDAGSVLVLRISGPRAVVWIDFAAGEVGAGERDDAAAQLAIDADSLHHLGMNRLAPAQVARAVEERRIDATGSFELMLLLLASLDPLGAVWRETLGAHGRDDLLDVPAPPATPIYSAPTDTARQAYVPEWSARAKRAVSKSTRRVGA
jgi:hypothetical protein